MTVTGSSESGLKILLTDGSSISTREILYDLGPRHTIDILDSNPLCMSRFSRFVRRWYRCPRFSVDPNGFLRCLGERLAAEKYDVLLPMHDEIFLVARVREALQQRVALAVHDFSVIDRLQSKLQFLKICQDLQLPHPETRVVSSERELNEWREFPSFVKLDYGTAGQTVQLVKNEHEMRAAIAKFRALGVWSDGVPLLVQQPSDGTQSVFRGVYRRGELVSRHISTLVMRGVGGSAVVRESADHPAVVEHMRRFGRELGCHGPLFADYFYDEANQTPSFIEANPRIGDIANDFFSGQRAGQHWVDVALGREPVVAQSSRTNIRSHSAMLVVMSRALDGAGRRQLFRECVAQATGSGIYEKSEEELTRFHDDWLSAIPYLWVTARLFARPATA
ncbi:MAG TPA: hypothetical protein VH107_04195, partial [Lacipirellulaceae bacterium]|nr:hypothetical protein [Lacipirellulaceae bacterium]